MTKARSWPLALLLVLAANVVFLLLNVSALSLPVEPIRERVRSAFEQGDLTRADWRHGDARRGFNQYNDCLILMMAMDRSGSPLSRAIGPHKTPPDGVCASLGAMIGGEPVSELRPYTRYWHGYLPVAASGMILMDLSALRWALRLVVVASLLALAASGWRDRRVFGATLSLALTGLLFWGLPYFGQGLSHAPGDAIVMLGLAGLVYRRMHADSLVLYCAVFGAGVAYIEFLTGQLPIAAGLLVPLVFITSESAGWKRVTYALGAFAAGAVMTVLVKQGLALAFVTGAGGGGFRSQLGYYAGEAYTTSSGLVEMKSRFLHPLAMLLRRADLLTYGSRAAMLALYIAALFAWAGSSLLAWRRGQVPAQAAFVVGASALVAWSLLLPAHTAIHAWWMARMLILPIGLGFASLAWHLSRLPVETQPPVHDASSDPIGL